MTPIDLIGWAIAFGGALVILSLFVRIAIGVITGK